jgi:hypothetical protein
LAMRRASSTVRKGFCFIAVGSEFVEEQTVWELDTAIPPQDMWSFLTAMVGN